MTRDVRSVVGLENGARVINIGCWVIRSEKIVALRSKGSVLLINLDAKSDSRFVIGIEGGLLIECCLETIIIFVVGSIGEVLKRDSALFP